ncbi:semaphorin-4A-like [Arapaima gigas]
MPRSVSMSLANMHIQCYFGVCLFLLGTLNLCLCHLTPRVSFPIGSPGRSIVLFSNTDIGNTTTLLLSDDEKSLFVGARDAVLLLDVSQPGVMEMKSKLDWSPSSTDLDDCSMKGKKKVDCHNFIRVLRFLNNTHVYACGTHAFSPFCTYIDVERLSISGKVHEGRGRCPYDPYQRNTAIVVDGELYTGTVADYRGNRPVISRYLSQAPHTDLKLDDTLGWLEDPTFVSSTILPSKEKVYFFFSEVGREYDFIDKLIVSRVAQVCTSDVGGQRTLQRRWTTFAKAQLLCHHENELPYNVIQDVIALPPEDGTSEDEMLFYGIFTSQWSVNSGRSAVCRFLLKDIKAVFSGNYKVLNRDTLRWSTRLQEKTATPGQASCGLHSASDNTLRFVKDNFLADQSVQPVGRVLSLVSPDHRYTNIAAQRIQTKSGRNYTVLFLLTESGFLHKVVLSDKGPHIVEEVQVFRNPQPVKNVVLSVTKGVVFVGSSEGVAQVPVFNCSFYWSCAECVLARDPFCGWDHSSRACIHVSNGSHNIVQDVERGNAKDFCRVPALTPKSRSNQQRPPAVSCPPGEHVYVLLNEVVKLQCPEASHLAVRHWERPNSRLSPDLYLLQDDGSLYFLATPLTLGHYICVSVENGYQQTLAVYSVTQRTSTTPQAVVPLHKKSQATTMQTALTTVALTSQGIQPEVVKTTVKIAGSGDTEPELATNEEVLRVTTTVLDEHSRQDSKNLSSFRQPRLTQADSHDGELQSLANSRTYYRELVAVTVMLVMSLCVLLMGALYTLRPHCYRRAGPQVCPGQDSDVHGSQERDPLSQPTVSVMKPSNQVQDKSLAGSNSTPRGSNGHLPNTPI